MDYIELAKQFLYNSHQFKNHSHQKNIDKTMQGEAFALSYIFKQGGTVLPNEISTEMNISTARVAAILNNLEEKGFITREVDKTDRRKILVVISQKGKDFAEERNKIILNSTAKMLEELGENDATELVRIIGRLAEIGPINLEDNL